MVAWDEVRALALELPEVEEGTSWGQPCFRVRGRPFAGLSGREEGALWAKCDPLERPLLLAASPEALYVTPHYEPGGGYLLVRLGAASAQQVRERLEDAWLLTAPKKLVAALDPG
jgi:hypothetical protein